MDGTGAFEKAAPVISLIGMVTIEGEIEVRSVMRVTALPQTEGARETEFTAELVDQNEKIIARAPLMQLQSRGGGCRCCCGGGDGGEDRGPYIFEALLTDVSDGAMLRITRRSDDQREQPRDVWTRRAPKNPPRITHFEVHVRETAGYARWEIADVCGETLECSLQFSKDGGKSWNGLAVALTGTEYHFDLTTLPRDEVVCALLVHDGFFTTKSISAPVCLRASTGRRHHASARRRHALRRPSFAALGISHDRLFASHRRPRLPLDARWSRSRPRPRGLDRHARRRRTSLHGAR